MKKVTPFILLFVLCGLARLSAQSCYPTIATYNGLAVNLGPVAGANNDLLADEFKANVLAKDFVRSAISPCNQPIEYRIRKSATGTGIPSTESVSFDCTELGVQLVEIWAGSSSSPDWAYTETYVIIQDPSNYCDGANPGDFNLDCGENDNIPPTLIVYNGLTQTLQAQPDGNSKAVVTAANLVFKKTDNCQGPVRLRIRKGGTGFGPPSTGSVTFDCDEQGTQLVEIWGRDVSGNWTSVSTYVQIWEDDLQPCDAIAEPGCSPDKTAPEVVALNGLAVNITPNSSGINAQVRAKWFTHRRFDNCSGIMTVRISKSGEAIAPPSTGTITYDCNELGTQFVDIWVGDEAGNWSKTSTYIIVQDNFGGCGNSPRVVMPEWKQQQSVYSAIRKQPKVEYAVDGLSVQPNPTAGTFNLTGFLELDDYVQVELYNSLGQQVRLLSPRQWQAAGDLNYQFEIGELPNGLYRCAIRTGSGVQTMTVVKN